MQRIADYFGVSESYLLGKESNTSTKHSKENDILNEVDIAFYDGYKELTEDDKETVRDNDQYAIFLDFTKIHTTKKLRGTCYHELGHTATGTLHKVSKKSPCPIGQSEEGLYLTCN